jgi:DnaJ-class molecular chaperone
VTHVGAFDFDMARHDAVVASERRRPCFACEGSGWADDAHNPCPDCNGSGERTEERHD